MSAADDCDIHNNIIVKNGSSSAAVGGLAINAFSDARIVEFNTIADNIGSGISCATFGVGDSRVRNNIVVGNKVTGCKLDYSLVDGTTATDHNRAGAAAFRNTTSMASPDFYRIGAQSAAIDAADPAATLTTDIDGDHRPTGCGFDIGADEYVP